MLNVESVLNRLVEAVKLGAYKEASNDLIQLLHTRPNLNESWLGVSRMALMIGDVNAAKRALQFAKPVKPSDLNFYLQVCAQLIECGEFTQALATAESLYEQSNGRPEVSHFLGTAYAQIGKVEEAKKHLRHTIAAWPTSGATWLTLASISHISTDSADYKKLLSFLPSVIDGPNKQNMAVVYSALCQINFANQQVEKAFEYASLANQSMNQQDNYNDSQDKKSFAACTEHAQEPGDSNSFQGASSSTSPIFIVGLPRSGTTLLEQVLCSHSQVIGGGEFNGLERACRMITKGSQIGSTKEHFNHELILKNKQQIRKVYLQYTSQRFGENGMVVDKSLNNSRYLHIIRLVFPESPIVVIDRSPMDTAWSCYRTHFSQGLAWTRDLSSIGQYFVWHNVLLKAWNTANEGLALNISYENLVTQPTQLIPEILAYCGLAQEEGVYKFYENSRPVLTASVSQVRQTLNTQSVNSAAKVKELMTPFSKVFDQT